MQVPMEDLDKLNKELQPVFRLTSVLSAGCPGGCPPGISNAVELLNLWIHKVCSLSTADCQRLADAGDPEMMHDFALRAAAGIELPSPNSLLAERYWNKILICPRSTTHLIGTAHAQLILFTGVVTDDGHAGRSSHLDDFKRAGTHAELAAQAGLGRAPNVLKLGRFLQDYRYGEHKGVFSQWKHFWAAVDGWVTDRQAALDKDSAKRVARPSRYTCAAPGCSLEASTGKLLRSCGGKCEDAYKPRYCTKECQVADWKNHKPMCKPGLKAAKAQSTKPTGSAMDHSIRIQRHDVAIGADGVVITPTQVKAKSSGQYSVNVGGVKLHSSSEHLSAQQVKEFAAVMKSGSKGK
ncbi:hypothetical protein FB451DRAFT_1205915 [Mycena latifolia]|nr:hypothetical protein FB451DRAFT_1205915 [Mycena latifolia]